MMSTMILKTIAREGESLTICPKGSGKSSPRTFRTKWKTGSEKLPGETSTRSLFYVNFARAIAPRVKKDKPFKYEGYVLKRELAAFEIDEIDQFSEWLTSEEYTALSEKQKRQYQYYRWNDPYGDYWIYQTLSERIRTLAGLFVDSCESEIGGSIYEGIPDSAIRVYIYRS